MSNDPATVLDALDRAQDAFEDRSATPPTPEEGIATGGNWETQLTKACKLLDVIETIQTQNGHYTAVIELSFGTIERSIEAYAVAMTDTVGCKSFPDFADRSAKYR